MDNLSDFRRTISGLDVEIIKHIAQRLDVCKEVAILKFSNNVPVMQPGRVSEVKTKNSEFGEKLGLNPQFVENLYGLIIDEACRIEESIIKENKK